MDGGFQQNTQYQHQHIILSIHPQQNPIGKRLEDIKAGRVHDADKAIAKLQRRRKAKSAAAARSAKQRD